MNSATEKYDIELAPSNLIFHEFAAEIGEVKFRCRAMKMKDCLYLWIGDFTKNLMNDLSFGFPVCTDNKKESITTKIIGSIEDMSSLNMAKRLSLKFGKPVYISFNVAVDSRLLPTIEKRINEEFQTNKNLLFL